MSAQRKDEKLYVTLGYLHFWSQDLVLQKSNVCMLLRILRIFGTFRIPVLIVEI